MALLLALVLCVGMMPSAFAAQEDNYHDPAEHWMEALNRTNELDANSVVTIETFNCCECGQATSFQVFRVPEYTRNGETALTRNVKYSDGTCLDGESKGDLLDGTPGKDAYYTGYHWTKAVCKTCGTFNTNMGATNYSCGKNVYWLYDCAADFFEELPEPIRWAIAGTRAPSSPMPPAPARGCWSSAVSAAARPGWRATPLRAMCPALPPPAPSPSSARSAAR